MDQYEHIRRAHKVYGKSIREIARIYKHSRKTVRKALKGIEPKYRRKAEVHYPVIGSHTFSIDEWLQHDLEIHRKQRHTAHRVYTRLVKEQGYTGSESTIRAYVRKKKTELGLIDKEAMIPLEANLESGAELDWGDADIILNGVKKRVKIFCMRSKFSGKIFVRVYPNERQEMFFDGHMEGFDYFGGVFKKMIYDNLKTAVQKILLGRKRSESQAFHSFRSYYCFDSIFCTPSKGNEKGGVEGLVGYARRNFLVPLPEVETIDELNEELLKSCTQHDARKKNPQSKGTIEDLFELEKEHLISLPRKRYVNYRILKAKVSKQQIVRVDRNYYSVPMAYIRMQIEVHLGCFDIRFYSAGKKIACHRRLFGCNKYQFDPYHYLRSLERKPGALDMALPLKQWRESWPDHYRQTLHRLRAKCGHSKGSREFIKILQLHMDYPESLVSKAMQECLSRGSFSSDSVKQMLRREDEAVPSYRKGLEVKGLPAMEEVPPNLTIYDRLSIQEVA